MAQVLILNGPAGVGKTTVSARLAARVAGAVVVGGDSLRAFAPADARDWLGPGAEVVRRREARRTDRRPLGERVDTCYKALEASLPEAARS